MISPSAHPRGGGDPVLWLADAAIEIVRSTILKPLRLAGQNWVPAYAGMSGESK